MNPLILAILFVVAVNEPIYAHPPNKKESGFQKVLRSMFTPRTKKVEAKPKRKSHPHRTVEAKSKSSPTPFKTITVDPEWMARYWELEGAWDYPIPEDDLIKWENGKYIIPFMVLQHYEDMEKTPRRIARPQSDASSSQAFSLSGLY